MKVVTCLDVFDLRVQSLVDISIAANCDGPTLSAVVDILRGNQLNFAVENRCMILGIRIKRINDASNCSRWGIFDA